MTDLHTDIENTSSNYGYLARVYQIFIASPSDVQNERKIIYSVLNKWNYLNSQKEEIVLLPLGWETHSYPMSGNPPQTTINEQILEKADLLIGVFWTRIGTETDGGYQSGTVEEYEKHVQNNKPAMLYFSNNFLLQDHDSNQFTAVKKFKESIRNKCFYKEYENEKDFEEKLFEHISLFVNERLKPSNPILKPSVEMKDVAKIVNQELEKQGIVPARGMTEEEVSEMLRKVGLN
jgi:hypothetical protein